VNGTTLPELQLPPAANSVRAARRFLRRLLLDAGREEWVDSAEVALSEVVTNAVLHAHTALTITVDVRKHEVLVEVADGNTALPAQRQPTPTEATTGRGMELVSALTLDRGVRATSTGKVVWFTVGDGAEEQSAEELLAAWDVDAGWEAAASSWHEGEDNVRHVVLQRLPPTLWLAAREHHHALLRELVLYLAEHGDAGVTAEDVALADEARTLIWTTLNKYLDQGGDDAGPAIDLPLRVPARLARAFGTLQDVLDLGERLSERDLLLVRPGLPEIIAVRDWLCEQVMAQVAGVDPSAWAGTDQDRFTELVHDRVEPDVPRWDVGQVADAERGVVAADDANRIIAVSRPLAQATGWEPEELVGRRVVALVPPAMREAHVAGFSRHLSTGKTSVLGTQVELPVLHRDGRELRCRVLIEQADVQGGRPVYLAWIAPIED
jgi:PAS domain S-box-containing protein